MEACFSWQNFINFLKENCSDIKRYDDDDDDDNSYYDYNCDDTSFLQKKIVFFKVGSKTWNVAYMLHYELAAKLVM